MIRRGKYILVFKMPDADIRVGALGMLHFGEGTYCYIGSAMNGLDQRIARHMSEQKTIRWHIDYLTVRCSKIEAYEAVPHDVTECGLGNIVSEIGGRYSAAGFGCSDCRCRTHLFMLDGDAEKKLISDSRFSLHGRPRIRI
ncbi:MAG: GIY-YIG nuclease family protein [Candidatus Methanoplasma sp.]|jgi:Uri superfamily endonuclease|nr:GIY-YIG nuclease family protein [Candidatus Methanoplasma sp.]